MNKLTIKKLEIIGYRLIKTVFIRTGADFDYDLYHIQHKEECRLFILLWDKEEETNLTFCSESDLENLLADEVERLKENGCEYELNKINLLTSGG